MTGWRPALALVAAMLAAGPVFAEPKDAKDPKITAQDRQDAHDLVNRAIAKSQIGDHRGAIDSYLKAFKIVPDPRLLSNIGAEFQQLGKPREALDYFCMYLQKDASGTSVPFATAQAKALQAQLGNKVGDGDVCAEPSDEPSEPEPVKPRRPPKSPPPTDSDPPTEQPATTEALPPEKPNSSLRIASYAAGIGGAAVAGFGIYEGVRAKDISDEINHHPKNQPWGDNIRSLEASGQHFQHVQIEAMIGGGALIASGVVLFLLSRPGEPEHRDRSLAITPTLNGFTVAGRF